MTDNGLVHVFWCYEQPFVSFHWIHFILSILLSEACFVYMQKLYSIYG